VDNKAENSIEEEDEQKEANNFKEPIYNDDFKVQITIEKRQRKRINREERE
jgi:hypothetical protein